MSNWWCNYIWDCTSSTSPHAVPEISAMPLVLAVCVVFIVYAVIADRSLK